MPCNDTLELTANGWFWGSKVCKIILAPLAVILNILLIMVLRKCTSIHMHVNMRCLLINLSVSSLIASVYLLLKSVYTVSIFAFDDPCKLEVSFFTCKIQEAVFVFCKLPVLGSILGLGIERAYAIRRVNSYHNSRFPLLAIVVMVVIWSISFAMTGVLLFTVGKGTMPYCNALFIYDKTVIRALSAILLPLEVVGVCIYVMIWWMMVRNFKPFADDIEYTLNGRYQRRLTVVVTRAMLPSSILHAICWTIILGIAASQITFLKLTILQDLILSQYLFYVLLLLHMLLHPILCFVQCDFLRIGLLKMLPCAQNFLSLPSTQMSIVDITPTNDSHFEMLNIMWDTEHIKVQHKKSRHQLPTRRSSNLIENCDP